MADITNIGQPPIPSIPFVTDTGERLDPAIMSFLMQASIAAQTAKMRLLEESKVPVGDRSFQVAVTDTVMEIPFMESLISCSVTNKRDSAGSIYCCVNEQLGPMNLLAEIEPGESKSWNFEYPTIEKIYIQAYSGLTATAKLFCEVGRWR